jgi:hypothetical protein
MGRDSEPVTLELATLPREQVGPFLLLGLDKAADKKAVDAHWADRLKWARKGTAKVPLEDINWAREVLGDTERRIRADAASLNADTTDGVLAQFARSYGVQGNGPAAPLWQAQDSEKALADYRPPAEVPDAEAVRAALAVPQVPEDVPAVALLLERLAQLPLDPWAVELKVPSPES